VPQTNNIAISSGASLTYFILSFVTLGLLYCTYEIVNFGYRSLLMWWRLVSVLYGIALLILGAILLGTELGNMTTTCASVWAKMSQNQKMYFSNVVDNLEAERTKNVSMCGAFAIVVGLSIIVMGVTQHLLYSESAVKWKAPSTSRLPPQDQHEKVNFVYFCYRDESYDGPHNMLTTQNNEEKEDLEGLEELERMEMERRMEEQERLKRE
jgi:hypothetical protein